MGTRTGYGLHQRTRKFFESLVAELVAAVEAEFRLNKPRDDGITPRQAGAVNNLTVPPQLEYLTECFYQIRGGSEGRLSHRDIHAWSSISGIQISPFDADVILRMDVAFIRVQDEPIAKAPGSMLSQFAKVKQHEDNMKAGIRMKYVNPGKP